MKMNKKTENWTEAELAQLHETCRTVKEIGERCPECGYPVLQMSGYLKRKPDRPVPGKTRLVQRRLCAGHLVDLRVPEIAQPACCWSIVGEALDDYRHNGP